MLIPLALPPQPPALIQPQAVTVQQVAPLAGAVITTPLIDIAADASPDAQCVRATLQTTGFSPRDLAQVNLSGQGRFTGTLDASQIQDGGYSLRLDAFADGACAGSADATVRTALTLDRTPPGAFAITTALSAGCPRAECIMVGATGELTLAWEAASGASTYRVMQDEEQVAQSTSRQATITNSLLRDGATLRVIAVDSAGLTRTSQNHRVLLVDREAPTGSFVLPAASAWISGRTAFRLSVRDAGAAGMRDVTVCKSARRCTTGNGDITTLRTDFDSPFLVNTRQIGDGRHQLVARLRDIAGNTRDVFRDVTVDNTRPTFDKRRNPKALNVRGTRAMTFFFAVDDNLAKRISARGVIRKGSRVVRTLRWRTTSGSRVPVTIPKNVRAGRYRISVQLKDQAGNITSRAIPLRVTRPR